ncbi:MAG: hypothetical protein IT328_21400 [Caldilineaceae bacterium]|nr:hypothetical protein [Caldilineaceae bacterium]
MLLTSIVTRFTVPLRAFILVLILSLVSIPNVVLAGDISISSHLGETCFAVADERAVEGGADDPADTLTSLDRTAPENTSIIGLTGTFDSEGITFGPSLQLFGNDAGYIGTFDLTTGAFTPLSQPLGTGGGVDGEVLFTNLDGMAYSLDRDIIFGVRRRNTEVDLLFAINPYTGAHIPDYFGPEGGPKTDYVPVPAILDDQNNPLTDVDDIQFDPVTGILYGTMNTGGRGGILVTIDVDTGTPTPITTFRFADTGDVINDVEGISFANDGTMYVSTGDNFNSVPDNRNRLFHVDPVTGLGTLVGAFPVGPKDYEAIACLSAEAAIVLNKYTNGPGQEPDDADTPTGPQITEGDPVTWTYIFTNTGVLTLTELSLVDDHLGIIGPLPNSSCLPAGTVLPPGRSLTCTATGIAVSGQYSNTGTVSGQSEPGPFPVQVVTSTDPSHYFGLSISQPAIDIVKFTNGEDADTPTGPTVEVGSTVTWTYEVRNVGNVPLSNVTVTDDQPGVTPVYVSGDANGNNLLEVGETWLFQATGIAVAGQYANMGTVTGTPPDGPNVTDTNPSHYFGAFSSQPGIDILKFTNGEDADTPTGPTVTVGSTVTWTYEVRNTGNVPLNNVTVTDDQPGVTPVYVSGDTDGDSLLDQDEVWLFQATGIAVAGQYANTGTVTGTPPDGPNVTDTNPSHYFGVEPSSPAIDIIKFTNGEDADTPRGPEIEIGTAVTWTYEVRNTGNVPLSNITVTDDQAGVTPVYVSGDANGNDLLEVGEVWLFQATGIAVGGQYANIGTVTGTPPDGPSVTDSNPSHYFGVDELPPTSLPVDEQPQDQQSMFLPTIESGE